MFNDDQSVKYLGVKIIAPVILPLTHVQKKLSAD